MTIDAGTSTQRSRRPRSAAITLAVIVLGLALAVFAWHKIQDIFSEPDATAPSCSWPVHVEHANSVQSGLIRCYLQAIAHHSTSELRSVVPSVSNGGPTGFGSAAFAHSADARSGTATVTVFGDSIDGAEATVAIHYADGAHADLDIYIANPTSSGSWRFSNIGIYPPDPPDPNAPPTAGP
jgi:hypothetical protein